LSRLIKACLALAGFTLIPGTSIRSAALPASACPAHPPSPPLSDHDVEMRLAAHHINPLETIFALEHDERRRISTIPHTISTRPFVTMAIAAWPFCRIGHSIRLAAIAAIYSASRRTPLISRSTAKTS